MSAEYLLILPYPPSINSYYRIKCIRSKPIKYISTKGKEYRKAVEDVIRSKDLKMRANLPLKVTIYLTPPDNRTRDIDNGLKCLFDSLTEAEFWEDDSVVRELHMSFRPVNKETPSAMLKIELLTEESKEL